MGFNVTSTVSTKMLHLTPNLFPRPTPAGYNRAPPSSKPRYVAWAGAVSSSPGTIELPAGLASVLQLPAGSEVSVELLPDLAAAAAEARVSPLSCKVICTERKITYQKHSITYNSNAMQTVGRYVAPPDMLFGGVVSHAIESIFGL